MIKKIISGGQTGADEAGLIVGKKSGLETGGTMPAKFLTETGYRPDFAELYNIVEHKSSKYVPRTYQNVKDSDGTIRFFTDAQSRGEICTLNAINQYKRPYIDVDLNNPIPVENVVSWVKGNNIQVLNVAGNRESTSVGICSFVENY